MPVTVTVFQSAVPVTVAEVGPPFQPQPGPLRKRTWIPFSPVALAVLICAVSV